MEFFKGIQQYHRSFPRTVVTVGNFDGVHLGHRQIISLAIEKAKQIDGRSIVYTFRPHPRVALQQDSKFQLLTTYEERLELFQKLDLHSVPDIVIEEPFSREFSTTSAEKFFAEILIKRLHAQSVVVGHDFGFGKSREGHLDTLTRFCKQTQVELTVVPPFKSEGEVISSSAIRKSLMEGRLEDANRQLGYRFSLRGVVVRGDGRGRKLGFPTANLQLEAKILPALGVYAVWANAENEWKPAVVNVGVRPTFQQPSESASEPVVEAHLLSSSSDLYGKKVELRFVRRLREEKRFASVDELKSQIRQDTDAAFECLNKTSP